MRGIGCVPLFNLMEDAATAEISRAQLWQWVHHGAVLQDGRAVTTELCDAYLDEELQRSENNTDPKRFDSYKQAASLIRELVGSPVFAEFLTVPAYERVFASKGRAA